MPEGIEGRVAYKGRLKEIIHQQMGGLRSCMGLTGCGTIDLLRTKAEFVRISGAGIQESHVHDVTITKESPNYRLLLISSPDLASGDLFTLFHLPRN